RRQGDGGWRLQPLYRPVAPTVRRRWVWNRIPVHLEAALDEVDDPVVANSGSRVEAALLPAVIIETGFGHLDDQSGGWRVSVGSRGGCPSHHTHIWAGG